MPAAAAKTYNYLIEFLNARSAKGRYAFTWFEAKAAFNISDKALNQNLFRLKTKNRIAQIRKGFYAILTPEYAAQGMIPVSLFIDDLMKSLNKNYYVGLTSAAALYGAAHQQPMEYSVVTEKPALRKIKTEKLKINFYVKKAWQKDNIVEKKTDAGFINVSSPELTALDLLYYINNIGLNRIVTILQELTDEIKAPELYRTAKAYPQTAAIQRLGYLLDEELRIDKLPDVLWKVLKDKKLFPVLLSSKKNKPIAILNNKWKVIKNVEIEGDL